MSDYVLKCPEVSLVRLMKCKVPVRMFELEDDGSYRVGEGRICVQPAVGRNVLSA